MKPLRAGARRLLLPILLVPAFLHAEEPSLHFKPREHSLGDVHPFFKEGRCFLYYLKPGHYESALVQSDDLLHWTAKEITHEPVDPDDWISPYFVLGVFHDPSSQLYRSFYGHNQGRIVSSFSRDLLHWSCAPKAFQIPPANYYQRRRDPFVFFIPELAEFGCVMTTQLKDRPKERAGAISLATSPDLQQWHDLGPIIDPGHIGEPECPQMIHLGVHWYVIASIYDRAVGGAVYWTAERALGPWPQEPPRTIDGKDLCAAQIAVDIDAALLFGWIPLKRAKPGQQTWGGHLALPREIYPLADGTLGSRLPATLRTAFEKLPWRLLEDRSLHEQAQTLAPGIAPHFIAEFRTQMPTAINEIRLNFAPLGEVILKRSQLSIRDAEGNCWSQAPAQLPHNESISVSLLIDGDIVELFVDERYSLAARVPARTGPLTLSIQTDRSSAPLTAIRFSPLPPSE